MEKHINQKKDHSGDKYYMYNGFRVRESQKFLYEICINLYWKSGFCILENKIFQTDKLLNIKKYSISKRYKNYIVKKELSIIGVPKEFIDENNLPIYELNTKKHKKK